MSTGRRRPKRHNRVYHRARRRLVLIIEGYSLREQIDEEVDLVSTPVQRMLARLRMR